MNDLNAVFLFSQCKRWNIVRADISDIVHYVNVNINDSAKEQHCEGPRLRTDIVSGEV